MAKVTLAADTWTSIPLPAGGSALIECRKDAAHISTDGTQPADPFEAVWVASGQSIVVREGLTVLGHPWEDGETIDVYVNPI